MLKVTNGWNIYVKYNTFFLKFIIIIKHDISIAHAHNMSLLILQSEPEYSGYYVYMLMLLTSL